MDAHKDLENGATFYLIFFSSSSCITVYHDLQADMRQCVQDLQLSLV